MKELAECKTIQEVVRLAHFLKHDLKKLIDEWVLLQRKKGEEKAKESGQNKTKRTKNITVEERVKSLLLYRKGLTPEEIADKLKTYPSVIKKYLKIDLENPKRLHKHWRLRNEEKKMIEKIKSGMSLKDVAKEYNCSKTAIRKRLRKYIETDGLVELLPKKGIRKMDNKLKRDIIADYNNGLTPKDIAIKYEINPVSISRLIFVDKLAKKRQDLREAKGKRWIRDISKEEIDEIMKERFVYGLSVKEISMKRGIGSEGVRKIIQRRKDEIMKRYKGGLDKLFLEMAKEGFDDVWVSKKANYPLWKVRTIMVGLFGWIGLKYSEYMAGKDDKNIEAKQRYYYRYELKKLQKKIIDVINKRQGEL